MKNRLAKILLSAAAVAAFAAPVGAQARQGGDDPAGHVRHAAHTTSTTTTQTATRTRHRHRHHGRHQTRRADDSSVQRRGRGADDGTTERRGRGTDDGPNHS
jgi:Ni/Co efflux regulator RcnB